MKIYNCRLNCELLELEIEVVLEFRIDNVSALVYVYMR